MKFIRIELILIWEKFLREDYLRLPKKSVSSAIIYIMLLEELILKDMC